MPMRPELIRITPLCAPPCRRVLGSTGVLVQSAAAQAIARPNQQCDQFCLSVRSGFHEHGFQLGPRGRNAHTTPASARSHVSRSLVGIHRGYELSNTANRRVRQLAIHARFFLGRRWPSGIPSARAFCLREAGVRLSALEMVLTGVLSLECCLSSFTSARVQSRRTIRFLLAIVLAISFSFFVRRL